MEYSKRNLRHKLGVVDDVLVASGSLPANPDRVLAGHTLIKAREVVLAEELGFLNR